MERPAVESLAVSSRVRMGLCRICKWVLYGFGRAFRRVFDAFCLRVGGGVGIGAFSVGFRGLGSRV